MRINSIQNFYNKTLNFKGQRMIKYIHFNNEDEVRDYPLREDFPEYYNKTLAKGKIPLRRIKSTYEPDIYAKCTYYYAEDEEFTGDTEAQKCSAVIGDIGYVGITEEMVKNEEGTYSFDDINKMIKVLKRDLETSMFNEDCATTLDEKETEKEKQEQIKHLIETANKTIADRIQYYREHFDPNYIPAFMKENN